MSGIWTVSFWKATGERAIKTFAQSLGAILLADGTGLLDTAWTGALSMSGMAAVISLLMSVGGGVASRRSIAGPTPSFRRLETPQRKGRR